MQGFKFPSARNVLNKAKTMPENEKDSQSDTLQEVSDSMVEDPSDLS